MRPQEFINKHIDEASLALIKSLMRIDPTVKAAKDYCVFVPFCMLSPPSKLKGCTMWHPAAASGHFQAAPRAI